MIMSTRLREWFFREFPGEDREVNGVTLDWD